MSGRNVIGWIFIAAGVAFIAAARWKTRHLVEWDSLMAMWYPYLIGALMLWAGYMMSTERRTK